MPSNDDDQAPELEHFLEDCRRFMAAFPTLWGEQEDAPVLDWGEVATDQMVTNAHANREGEVYPTAEQLVRNLPLVLRALCDHLLEVHPNALDVARRLASIIDAVETVQGGPAGSEGTRH